MQVVVNGTPLAPYVRIPRLDIGGIFILATTGKLASDESLDYGICPLAWRSLPNEGVLVWKVRHPASDTEAGLPVSVVIPSALASTVTNPNTITGAAKIPVVDNKGTHVVGSDVTNPVDAGGSPIGSYTEHWVYFNKESGIFRLMGILAQAPATAATGEASTVQAAKTK